MLAHIHKLHMLEVFVLLVIDTILILHKNAAACMTWDLAESGSDFITSVINGADLVPTFSAASVDDLRAEVTILNFVLFVFNLVHENWNTGIYLWLIDLVERV